MRNADAQADLASVRDARAAVATLLCDLGDLAREEFAADTTCRRLVQLQFIVLGEAVNAVSESTRQAFPDVPWRGTIKLRNVLVHGYMMIDYGRMWDIATRDLPTLAAQLEGVEQWLHARVGQSLD